MEAHSQCSTTLDGSPNKSQNEKGVKSLVIKSKESNRIKPK